MADNQITLEKIKEAIMNAIESGGVTSETVSDNMYRYETMTVDELSKAYALLKKLDADAGEVSTTSPKPRGKIADHNNGYPVGC